LSFCQNGINSIFSLRGHAANIRTDECRTDECRMNGTASHQESI
jgi:hypothetical protein